MEARNPGQPEHLQPVTEVMVCLWPYIEQHPRYAEHGLLERLIELDRAVLFRVSWVDDHGAVQVNRGFRIPAQFEGQGVLSRRARRATPAAWRPRGSR